ncbi:terminase small subunit [Clostridium saccharoperbutylacetonicum]|uniref:terminase small subunit n=1 Tax=Clostridium saccharoperbutylacetonicum TaxID=36745 RepID=UPI0039EAD3E7
MDKKISEKQKKFCDYYLELGNASEAYIKAGYTAKGANANAARLIANDSIKSYIEERRKQMDEERIAKPQEVLEYLTRVMNGQELDQFGLDAALSDRTKAAELLAKRYRLFDVKDNKTQSDTEKEKLEIEYKRLQNKKLEAEIKNITGDNIETTASDGFIQALNGTAQEDWEDEKEDN